MIIEVWRQRLNIKVNSIGFRVSKLEKKMKRKEFFRGLITALKGGNLENKNKMENYKKKIIKKILYIDE